VTADLTQLHPDLLPIAQQWLDNCHAANLKVSITVTWRSDVAQEQAKADGLSKAGAGQSPHNVCDASGNPASCAFDFACFDDDAHYITDGTDARYTQAGSIGKDLGLVWGGDFSSIFDPDHLELQNWRSRIKVASYC
jgi:peptidoglycan LD-endopeptidase CwlK